MRRKRDYIRYAEKLAAALYQLHPTELADLRARKAPASDVLALFSPDHIVLHALDGADKWWNIHMTLRREHAVKSRADATAMAKTKRIEAEQQKHQEAMRAKLLAPTLRPLAPRSSMKSRPMMGTKASGWKKPMVGKPVQRSGGQSRTDTGRYLRFTGMSPGQDRR